MVCHKENVVFGSCCENQKFFLKNQSYLPAQKMCDCFLWYAHRSAGKAQPQTQILCVFVTYSCHCSTSAPSPKGAADRNRLPLTVCSSDVANSNLAGCVPPFNTSQDSKGCKVAWNPSKALQRARCCWHLFNQKGNIAGLSLFICWFCERSQHE